MNMTPEKVIELRDATATAEFTVGRLFWNEIRRIFLNCQMMYNCENCELIESTGFLTRTFYVTGPYWEVHHINEVVKALIIERAKSR